MRGGETKGSILKNADAERGIDGPMIGGERQREAFSRMLMPRRGLMA
jgi:hypothetical protein